MPLAASAATGNRSGARWRPHGKFNQRQMYRAWDCLLVLTLIKSLCDAFPAAGDIAWPPRDRATFCE
jgi:hypothetical protein